MQVISVGVGATILPSARNTARQTGYRRGLQAKFPINSKSRTLALAPTVTAILKRVHLRQLENRLRYGECYENGGFVFTDELGHHLSASSVYKSFKKVMEQIGSPETRFHDLRHSYAVASIRSGNDIKTVQENLGHATAAFTLDVYGHVTEEMKREGADQLEQFIKAVNA